MEIAKRVAVMRPVVCIIALAGTIRIVLPVTHTAKICHRVRLMC